MHLLPIYMNVYGKQEDLDNAVDCGMMDCIECGACSYICPGRLHLTHSFKVGKQKVKEAAAKAAKAAKVKFRWGKSLKSAQKQAEETGLPIVLLFTGTSWCGYCIKLEKEILSKKEFKQGMDGVAIGVKFEFGSSDFSKSKEAKTYRITGVPAMVVVDAEGKELGRTGYIPGQTPVQYVEFFKKYAPKTAEAK